MLKISIKVAYIVGENRRRAEINVNLLNKFYTDQEAVTIQAKDNLPADAYVDPNLPYTQTGYEYFNVYIFQYSTYFYPRRTTYHTGIEEMGTCYVNCEFYCETIQRKWF